MLSDTDTSDDELLLPNGYEDVAPDIVSLDFNIKEDTNARPRKKKGRKRGRSVPDDSFDLSQGSNLDSPLCPPTTIQDEVVPDLVLDDSCDVEESVEEVENGGGKRRSKRIRSSFSKSSRKSVRLSSRNSSFASDFNESESCVLDGSPLDVSVVSVVEPESSFGFDEGEEVIDAVDTQTDDVGEEEVKIRVSWKGSSSHTFPLRKFQKMKEIFSKLAEMENVHEDRIYITYHEKPVTPNDTPASLKIAGSLGFFEGGITDVASASSRISQSEDSGNQEDPDAIKLSVQRKGVKEKHTVYIRPQEKISVLISKLSEDLKIPFNSIKLMFDGCILPPTSTPEDEELEGDECIDLIEIK